ncbi:metallophosphoesterase family protein [Profundibacterium mesophilum]|uniref:3'5'-cyclic-nucleotide phosphodiesterase n=1 Tax=Profundibacterium mesophilum KAUST100406-0324 TaxID=1037889 RepID=A0A921NVN8_9RHOB|nr:metallophosphoesterase [Profundibacterium mesophilum]KAF0676503.1 3'5'-cyclic-nucleotide phosphodiesterase [Profundibacterium mesophilum KAUST100406-0324]
MRRVIHLSDLHFGRIREDLVDPLLATITEIDPDLVIVSGDLTQRARRRQFAQARAFIDRITAPVLTVPGNHDVPLDNLWVRLLRPFARYREIINPALEPDWSDEEINVIGVNTVNPFAWQSGLIRGRAVKRVCKAFDQNRHRRMRFVALHHPLEHAPGTEKRLMRGARKAAGVLAGCGADIVLCGHLHAWRADPVRSEANGGAVLLVQAGTGLSTRLRGEENDFNLLVVDGPNLSIIRYVAGSEPRFEAESERRFRRDGADWNRVIG